MNKGLISVLSMLTGAVIGTRVATQKSVNTINKVQELSDKHLVLFRMMNQWVKIKQEGKSLVFYFEKNGYKRIAIYGMSHVGETLLDELRDSVIEVAYGIDKNVDMIYSNVKIVRPDHEIDDIDAIVVTPVFFMNEIKEMLSQIAVCPILSLEDILYEL